MTIETKFEIGQEVFVLSWFVCPNCQGRSAHRQFARRAWYVSQHKARIGKIGVETAISEEWRKNSHGFRPDSAYSDFETRITYMTDQSGIGSGSVLDEKDVYGTLAEAESVCSERNAGNLTDYEGAVLKPEAH